MEQSKSIDVSLKNQTVAPYLREIAAVAKEGATTQNLTVRQDVVKLLVMQSERLRAISMESSQ
jgi:hypothetical protein